MTIFMEDFIKADLHAHLATREPTYSFRKLVEAMNKKSVESGLQGIVEMSNSEKDTRYRDMKERAKLEGCAPIDLGNAFYVDGKIFASALEIPTKYGHFLSVGVKEGIKMPEGVEPEDAVKRVCDNCGYHPAFVVPHMFSRDGMAEYLNKNPNFIEEIEGIEVWNGSAVIPIVNNQRNFSGANKKAQDFFNEVSKDYNIGAIISTDGHSLGEIFSSYTVIQKPDLSGKEAFANSLRSGIRESMGGGIRSPSYSGAIDHAVKMTGIITLGKLGINI